MDYQAMYQQKLTTAQEAVKVVKSGDWVDYTWCTNHPVALDKALAERKDELTDVKIRGGVTMWMPEIAKAEDAGDHFTWHSWHCSGIDRKIIAKGMGYFSPMRYSELPRFYRDGNAKVDVAMIQVTPMDKHGNFSYALACSHLADMLGARPSSTPRAPTPPWPWTRPWPPPTSPILCPAPSASSWRSTRICPGCTA